MPCQPIAGAFGVTLPAQNLSAGNERARGVRGGVRSDIGPVRVDSVAEPVLPARVRDTVPVRGEAGALAFGAQRPVSCLHLQAAARLLSVKNV